MLKKFLSVLLAAATVCTLSVPAFAATVTKTVNMTSVSGAPLDEDGKQYSLSETVAPGQVIYFLLPKEASILNNTSNFRFASRKVKNGKMVSSIKVVDKRFNNGATFSYPNGVPANSADYGNMTTNNAYGNNRYTYIAVTLKDTTSSDEFRVDLDFTFTVKKAGTYNFRYGNGQTVFGTAPNLTTKDNPYVLGDTPLKAVGDKITLKASFYVGNPQDKGDSSISVGSSGKTIKPVANEENEITFETNSDTLATLTFTASSNPDKFYAKLSTKWTSDLSKKFNNADAYIFRFSSATIDSTSRANLALNNPFDEDDVNPKKVYVYSVNSKGVLSNVTTSFKYNSDDDTFETRVRTLGTYIISDTKLKSLK